MLYIVSTPIGNLKDITLRALETLGKVDSIICEDTRRASILLNHYQIKKPLLVLNDFNESLNYQNILEKLKSGQNLALISDAGTPLISDPGFKLVRECLKENLEIDSIPGASSVISSLILSGLPPNNFFFLGYIPEKPGARQKVFEQVKSISLISKTTFIFFLSPYKIIKPLEEMGANFGDINIVLAKELTKIYQNVRSDKISSWLKLFKSSKPKGEYVLLFNLGE